MDKLIKKAPSVPRKTWVQTEKAAHEAWANLIATAPKAAQLMHILTARVQSHNAVVISHKVLASLLKVKSLTTVKKAIAKLVSDNWIEIRQIGESGTVNAYIINDRVVWTESRDKRRYSLFTASVIVSSEEQPDKDMLGKQEPLRWLPKIGEVQHSTGNGLPPPSQPHLPSMEPDLPAAGNLSDDQFREEDERQLDIVDFLDEQNR